MLDLHKLAQWQKLLGLLPIKLYPTSVDQFILLDGLKGDFCLDLQSRNTETDYLSDAWSSNTNNFVSVADESVSIHNWQRGTVEEVNRTLVEGNCEKFYQYLIDSSTESSMDVVPFLLEIFRKLRNLTGEHESGITALNLFFLLLACFEEGLGPREIDENKWGLSSPQSIPIDFEKYLDEFSEGILDRVKPNVQLILRHASGRLFQEARREVTYFDKSQSLFSPTLSGTYVTKRALFSSVHYTPSFLARTLVENALNGLDLTNSKALKIFDPACGSSEFLMEALKQLKARDYAGDVRVIGWDSSSTAISTSKYLLTYEQREWNERLTINVRLVEDSLSEEWDADHDLILMNPPYRAWDQMSKVEKDSVKASLGSFYKKRPNQASGFFYRAVRALGESGVLGCVIPSSLLTLDSYDKLRSEIVDQFAIRLIGKLGNFVFEEALTDVTILVGSRQHEQVSPLLVWTKNTEDVAAEALRNLRKVEANNLSGVSDSEFSIYRPSAFPFSDKNWKLMSSDEHELYGVVESLIKSRALTRTRLVFNVMQGIRTGNNVVFKVSKTYLQQLPAAEQSFFRPAVDNEAIDSGTLTDKTYIWYPYDSNKLLLTNEEELRRQAPTYFAERLLPNKAALEKRALTQEQHWWELVRYRPTLSTRYSKLVSTEFGNSRSFAFDLEGDFVVERGNLWQPRKSFEDQDDFYFYLALFSSSFFDSLLSIYSRQLAGGYWYDLGLKHTSEIPIPALTEAIRATEAYSQMSYIGSELSNGKFIDHRLLYALVSTSIYRFTGSTDGYHS